MNDSNEWADIASITGTFDDLRSPCAAEPCAWCGACGQCFDFHFYIPGRGCTDDTCPRVDTLTEPPDK